MSLMLVIMTI